jgi:UDP-N-acetyl-D-mannosaminuronate dehydrogenase
MIHNCCTSSINKVLIIGLGQLGLPVAKYVKEKGFDAYGFDISQKAMERAEKPAAIRKPTFDNDEYPYLCGPHPNMVGTVVVTES